MLTFGKKVVKFRIPILIISILLLIPAAIGYFTTRINYDILSYLPSDIETMEGQEILLDEFGTGAFSICVVEGMTNKDVAALKKEIEDVDHVKKVLWYDSLSDLTVPMEILPTEVQNAFNNADADSTLMMIMFDSSMSSDETLASVEKITKLTDKKCLLGGMSSTVLDIKKLCEKETVIYIIIAVLLSVIVLALTMDSYLVPLFFLLGIGMSIVYNLGTNFVNGEISFVTQSLSAVLQLAVTMDYSIFLWHSYEEKKEKYNGDKNRAMAHAISNTISSVVGSSITTMAGFIAMCFMTFTLGMDLGVVMAKGVVFGVIGCVTILPAMILIFDKALEKTRHKPIIPDLGFIGKFVTNKYIIFVVLFLVILFPAIYGYNHNKVYYDLAGTLPKDLQSVMANSKLDEDYNMGATHVIIADSKMETKQTRKMIDEISKVKGVQIAAGWESLVGPRIPEEMIPDSFKEVLDNGKYQMIFVISEYKVASDEVNEQINTINKVVDKYDDTAMVIGEAPCTQDLIRITDKDFKTVSTVSIALIFIIIALVLKSISLPIILVSVIEFAIFINMGIPGYTGTELPFIASIVIGTIQLGATVDYAILMTNKYKKARYNGSDKKEAVTSALSGSLQSVFVSALCFFAATFGVGMYSSNDMISALCILLARGAIVSLLVVAFILPAMFMVFDKIIIHTSFGFKKKAKKA